MTEKSIHRWHPIEDYAEPPQRLGTPEIQQLFALWSEQREALEDSQGLQAFNDRMQREWAIETGLLERIYTLDRGVTQLLIEQGIDASFIPHSGTGPDPVHLVAILRDHEEAIESLFSFVKGDRQLTTSYIKELHALLTRNQKTTTAVDTFGNVFETPLLRGDYKRQPNNPRRADGSVHEYCPPEQVGSEMDRLLELHHNHLDAPPEVEAAWLHHRFTQIHPFQDGNGRVARCLATLILLKAGWFPLTIRDTLEERGRYLDALEAADRGDLRPLVEVVTAAERKAFIQALSLSDEVVRSKRAEQVILATRRQLEARDQPARADWDRAKQTAARTLAQAKTRLDEIAKVLAEQTADYLRAAHFETDLEMPGGQRGQYFRRQILATANELGYIANTHDYSSWVRLILRTEAQAEILVSFHAIGQEFRGLLAASACFFRREPTGDGDRSLQELPPLSSELFQINFREPENDVVFRFEGWFEEALARGLELWRQGL